MAAVALRPSFRFPHYVQRIQTLRTQGAILQQRTLLSNTTTHQIHRRQLLKLATTERRFFVTATARNPSNSIIQYFGDVVRTRSLRPANPILTSFQELRNQQPDKKDNGDSNMHHTAAVVSCPTVLPDFTKFRPHHLPQAWDQAMKTVVDQIEQTFPNEQQPPDSQTLLEILQPLYYVQSLRELYMSAGDETEEWLLACCQVPSNLEDAVVEQLNKNSSSSSNRHWYVSLLAPARHVVKIQAATRTSSSSSSIDEEETLALYDSLAVLRKQFCETNVHDTTRAIMEDAAVGSASSFSIKSKKQSKLEQVEDLYKFLELHQRLVTHVHDQSPQANNTTTRNSTPPPPPTPRFQARHQQQQQQKRLTYADVMLQDRIIPNRKRLEQIHEQVAQHFLPTVYEEMERQDAQMLEEATKASSPSTSSSSVSSSESSVSSPQQYFTLDGVLGALMAWSRAVFGIAFYEETDRSKIKAWHPSVRLFYAYDETHTDETHNGDVSSSSSSSRPGRRLGSMYIDPFKRNYKPRDEWVCLIPTTPLTKTPILSLNVPPCWDSDPAFVQLEDVDKIFHEFGHGLHVLCSDQDLNHAPHAVDVLEMWSCFMEYWLLQDSVRQTLAHFSQWPEPIPADELKRQHDELVMDKIQSILHHVYEGMLELQLFSEFNPQQGDSLVEYQRRFAEHYRPMDVPSKGDLSTLMGLVHEHCTFEFVMARYHYLISDILAAQIFATFERKGLDDADAVRKCGMEFRRLLSTPADSTQGTMKALNAFVQQNPLILEYLLKYCTTDVQRKEAKHNSMPQMPPLVI